MEHHQKRDFTTKRHNAERLPAVMTANGFCSLWVVRFAVVAPAKHNSPLAGSPPSYCLLARQKARIQRSNAITKAQRPTGVAKGTTRSVVQPCVVSFALLKWVRGWEEG